MPTEAEHSARENFPINEAYRDWKGIHVDLKGHHVWYYHQVSNTKMISFISVCDVSNKIKKDNMMPDNNEAAFGENRSIITSTIKIIEMW